MADVAAFCHQGNQFDRTCAALLARGADADADADETTFNEITFGGQVLVWQGGCVETEQPGELTHAVLVLVPKGPPHCLHFSPANSVLLSISVSATRSRFLR